MFSSQDTETAANEEVKEFLSFVLGDENYALDIMTVQEIRGYDSVTTIANAPDFVKGVINLRGDMVPIIDLRIKFNVGEARYDVFTIVIVIHIGDRIVGFVVDGVSDVIRITEKNIQPPPEFGVKFDNRYLQGLVSVEEKMVILVNIDSLLRDDEWAALDAQNKELREPA